MRSIFIAVLVFIFMPSIVFASSMSDMFGFWISETALPSTGKKEILIIKHNSFQEGKLLPRECVYSTDGDKIIIKYPEYREIGEDEYNILYNSISFVNHNKIVFEFPNSIGTRVEQSYIRISEEEAQPYLR